MSTSPNHIEINKEIPCDEIKFDMSDFIHKILSLKNISNAKFEFSIISDPTIHKLNKTHLNHDYPTDIITFNLGDTTNIDADIYISLDTAKENAKDYNNSLEDEMKLLFVHGILHALGYEDYETTDKEEMEKEQDRLLALIQK